MRSIVFSLATLVACTHAWTMTGSSVSSFGGSVLMTTSAPTCPSHYNTNAAAAAFWEMKKGKPNVPPNMRGNYRRQKEMSEMRDQMVASQTPAKDGFPIFNLFVGTKKANVRLILCLYIVLYCFSFLGWDLFLFFT